MDAHRPVGPLPNVTTAVSAPRPTPTPPRIRFADALGRTLLRGAEGALRTLPGGPLMAVATRGGPPLLSPMSHSTASPGAWRAASPEGPMPGVAGAPGVTGETASLESSLAQSQEMNLYYLRIQEEVNAQNRSFTALSNVLKAEHDTVKTAIGNIR
jgi:hypothetical protein